MASLESGITVDELSSSSDSPAEIDPQPAAPPEDLIEDHIRPKLDPEFLRYFVDVVAKQPPAHTISLADVRADPDKYRSPIAVDSSRHERVGDHLVSSQDGASITVRVYHPDPAKFGPGPYPVHMNHHGAYPLPLGWTVAPTDVRYRRWFCPGRPAVRGATVSEHARGRHRRGRCQLPPLPRYDHLLPPSSTPADLLRNHLGQMHPRRLGRPQLGTHLPLLPFTPTSLTQTPLPRFATHPSSLTSTPPRSPSAASPPAPTSASSCSTWRATPEFPSACA